MAPMKRTSVSVPAWPPAGKIALGLGNWPMCSRYRLLRARRGKDTAYILRVHVCVKPRTAPLKSPLLCRFFTPRRSGRLLQAWPVARKTFHEGVTLQSFAWTAGGATTAAVTITTVAGDRTPGIGGKAGAASATSAMMAGPVLHPFATLLDVDTGYRFNTMRKRCKL